METVWMRVVRKLSSEDFAELYEACLLRRDSEAEEESEGVELNKEEQDLITLGLYSTALYQVKKRTKVSDEAAQKAIRKYYSKGVI
jgi:hypothetical protein